QLVGYVVTKIEACHMAGKNLRCFKFIPNNNNGRRLQIIAWEGEAERTEPDIAVYKEKCKKKDIRKISYHDSKLDYPLVQLDKIQGNLLPIVLRTCGYLKTTFCVKSAGTSTRKIAYTYITDGTLKLEITILDYIENDLRQGNFVEVIGFPEVKDDILFLNLETSYDMQKLNDEVKPLNWLSKGKKSITVPEYNNKRQKMN
ncbi:hypothetical protein KQX54_000031, partial [Cotesia glomerata]